MVDVDLVKVFVVLVAGGVGGLNRFVGISRRQFGQRSIRYGAIPSLIYFWTTVAVKNDDASDTGQAPTRPSSVLDQVIKEDLNDI